MSFFGDNKKLKLFTKSDFSASVREILKVKNCLSASYLDLHSNTILLTFFWWI